MSSQPLPPSNNHQQQHQSQQHLSYHTSAAATGAGRPGGPEQAPPRYQPPPQPQSLHAPKQQQRLLKDGYTDQGNKQRQVQQGVQLKPSIQPVSAYHNRPLRTSAPSSGRASSEDLESHRLPNQQLQYHQQQNDMLKFVARRSHDGQDPVVMQVQGPPMQRIPNSPPNSDQSPLQLQSLANEVRALKEANRRLVDDNQELRDLCCFLDDDRQKGRKLAREWQRFGRYTASVMRQEVAAYQSKLRQLDDKQQELIRDNLELKELCLYLDEERTVNGGAGCSRCRSSQSAQTAGGGGVVLRDDGDGSSSSTNADEPPPPPPPLPPPHCSIAPQSSNGGGGNGPGGRLVGQTESQAIVRQTRSAFSDQTMRYVRSLESRVRQLEAERRGAPASNSSNSGNSVGVSQQQNQQLSCEQSLAGRPEAVVRALQVLEVREGLESSEHQLNAAMLAHHTMQQGYQLDQQLTLNDHMDDGEKALVREMCNVVWRKLEEDGPPA